MRKEFRIFNDYRVYEDGSLQRIKTGNFLKFSINKKGYYITRLKIKKEWKTKTINRIVCIAWYGEPPDDGNYYEADHKDFDRLNNHKDNLQWLTKSENNQRAWDAGHKNNNGTNNGRSVLKETDVIEICSYLFQKCRPCDIARFFDVGEGSIRSIKSRRNWCWLTKDYGW